ncbi:tannase and feruloyl esterase [Stipitochalara longipes BDJ]|nr:tannase and feruloyl esterase [Stipitochalara longipes BDJ]
MDFFLFIIVLGIFFNTVNSHVVFERSVQSCTDIKARYVPGAHVVSIESKPKQNLTVLANPPFLLQDVSDLNICEVNVTLTQPNAGDRVLVQIWLPLNNWNGRFLAVGGSAWAAGLGDLSLAPVAKQGFAAASTNAGLSGDPSSPGLWALKDNGEVNWDLLTIFASRSVHDLAVVGKAISAEYYGTTANYSYWNGCSTGGRQGLVAAQMYPNDFDGILAASPAINWPDYVVAEHWPQVVMKEEKVFPSLCELNGVVQAAIASCDGLDGVKDNVITDLAQCKFDPFTAVGSKVQCDGKDIIITQSVASIIRKIWDGPKTATGAFLWYGLTIGAPMDFLANTTVANGTRIGNPFFLSEQWISYFLKADPNFNVSIVNSAELAALFSESSKKYGDLIGSANPDLTGLRKSGGKLLVWHGEADPLIFPQGTIQYRQRVEKAMGNNSKLDEFFRLFLAPGVDHCGQGATSGAVPSDPFGALMSWVENGTAPDILIAETVPQAQVQFTRKICRYPLVSKYRGSGDPNNLESYNCERAC